MVRQFLATNRDALLKKWIDLALGTYPTDSQRFLQLQKNKFANPVGSAITIGLGSMYDWIVGETDTFSEKLLKDLDGIVRIRAVQDFTASEAVSFVFVVKEVVREALRKQGLQASDVTEQLALESKIDALTLLAFDNFMKCREKLYELRAIELKNRTARILERASQQWGAEVIDGPEDRQHE
jgi:RsbT co-antagonist protein rsbRD N-terminal domain